MVQVLKRHEVNNIKAGKAFHTKATAWQTNIELEDREGVLIPHTVPTYWRATLELKFRDGVKKFFGRGETMKEALRNAIHEADVKLHIRAGYFKRGENVTFVDSKTKETVQGTIGRQTRRAINLMNRDGEIVAHIHPRQIEDGLVQVVF